MNTAKDDTRILRNENLCEIKYDSIIAACNGQNFPMSLTDPREIEVITKAVNIGIDSRLQACFSQERGDSYSQGNRSIVATEDTKYWQAGDELVIAKTLECSVSPESLCVLIRRLFEDMESKDEDGDDADIGIGLASCILTVLGFDDAGKFVGREALGLD